MSVREKDNPGLYTRIQEQNLLRQYDLLSNCVEIGLEKGIEAFDKYTVWAMGTELFCRRQHCSVWRTIPRGTDLCR
jgi:hypothetical protein